MMHFMSNFFVLRVCRSALTLFKIKIEITVKIMGSYYWLNVEKKGADYINTNEFHLNEFGYSQSFWKLQAIALIPYLKNEYEKGDLAFLESILSGIEKTQWLATIEPELAEEKYHLYDMANMDGSTLKASEWLVRDGNDVKKVLNKMRYLESEGVKCWITIN